jgi:hypothetical protein
MTTAGMGVKTTVGNWKVVAVAVTVTVGVGLTVGEVVEVGVMLGVLLGGRVGVTMTTSASCVTT